MADWEFVDVPDTEFVDWDVEWVETPGTVCWGHFTGVLETYARSISGNWTGTGTVSGSGNLETVKLYSGEYMESEIWNLGAGSNAAISANYYRSGVGGEPTIQYRTSPSAGMSGGWNSYTGTFTSSGYVQIKISY